MSIPLSKYPAKGDREVVPRGLPTSNPAFLRDPAGSSENHSSLVKSVVGGNADGEQWNDDEDSTPSAGYLDPAGYDPNISGPHPTEPLRDWQAGNLSGWSDNDDYMHFTYNTRNVAESRLNCIFHSVMDGDYDDNGGFDRPPMQDFNVSDDYEFGADRSEHQGEMGNSESSIAGITVDPIVRR